MRVESTTASAVAAAVEGFITNSLQKPLVRHLPSSHYSIVTERMHHLRYGPQTVALFNWCPHAFSVLAFHAGYATIFGLGN